jgi:putative solute:sodium symporter small subunit
VQRRQRPAELRLGRAPRSPGLDPLEHQQRRPVAHRHDLRHGHGFGLAQPGQPGRLAADEARRRPRVCLGEQPAAVGQVPAEGLGDVATAQRRQPPHREPQPGLDLLAHLHDGRERSKLAPVSRRSCRMAEARAERAYWRANLRLLASLLSVWAMVSYGCGILFVDLLNRIRIPGTGFPLGFWFAQQGSIYVFVALIFVYVWRMNRLDAEFDVAEE